MSEQIAFGESVSTQNEGRWKCMSKCMTDLTFKISCQFSEFCNILRQWTIRTPNYVTSFVLEDF
jgi:hypothetical protein